MAHKIESIDKVFTLTAAWHGLETIVPEITGYGYEVQEQPIYTSAGEVSSHKAICDDAGRVLSIMKSSYLTIPNARTWEAIQEALSYVEGARVVSAGSIRGRKQTFVTIELDGLSEFEAGGDSHTQKLVLLNSHDGSLALTAGVCVTRVVCANTVAVALSEMKANQLKIYHSKNAAVKIDNLNGAIEAMVKATETYKTQIEALADARITAQQAYEFATGFVAAKELSTRSTNQAQNIVRLFQKGQGNKGESKYDLFNGITEFYTHHATDNYDAMKAFETSEFGTYAAKKANSIAALTSGWLSTIAKGQQLLAA